MFLSSVTYEYDELNQLVRVNDPYQNRTHTYEYENGNILFDHTYAYTEGELPASPISSEQYFYEDSVWGDVLTGKGWISYRTSNTAAASVAESAEPTAGRALAPAAENDAGYAFAKRLLGENIQSVDMSAKKLNTKAKGGISTYSTNSTASGVLDDKFLIVSDEIGNPVDVDGMQFRWNGRQLLSINMDGIDVLSYSYNVDGQRTKKVFSLPDDGICHTYEYFYNGEILAGQKVTKVENGEEITYTLAFMYDNNGDVFGFYYNDEPYYYVKNAQNDIALIANANGEGLVMYMYDAWGNISRCYADADSDIAEINPLRYRSYYCDTELGMYYLNSRYYMPSLCRFLNADEVDVLEEDQDSMIEENLFAYCLNNPVNMADDDGTVAWWIAAAVTGAAWDAAFYCVEAAITGNFSWKGLGKAALKGAVTGLAFGAVGKIAGKAVKAVKVARTAKKASKAKKTSKVCSVLTKITKKSFCFVAGTEVLTDQGLVPIEDIQVGDLVWAEDPDTGEKALKPVVQLFVSETNELVRLLIEDEIILATLGHPFHVKGKGWVQAFDLEPGDLVTQKDGSLATVYGLWYIYSENPVTVYNFEVADFHTYFVGDNSLLVHNKGPCNGITKYSAKELAKKVSGKFHGPGGAKEQILKDTSQKIMRKVGNNPDIGLDKDGIIYLISRVNGKTYSTGLNIKWY